MKLGEVDRFLVARDGGRAVEYFLERLYVAHGLRERLLWSLLRVAGSRLAPAVLFHGSWTLEPETASLDPGDDVATEEERARWRSSAALLGAVAGGTGGAEGAGLASPGAWNRAILLRDYAGGRRGRLVVFPFTDGNGRPPAVLKLRGPGGPGAALEREWSALRRLRRLPPELRGTVPRPLDYAEDPGGEYLLMSHLPGSSAYVRTQNDLRPGRWVARHFRAAASWLAEFHLATRAPGRRFVPGPGERELDALRGDAGGGLPSPWYRRLVGLCRDHRIPVAAGHGDFWSRNLLLADGDPGGGALDGIGIVDWEHHRPAAPVWEDLMHFPVTYGTNYPWLRYRRSPVPEAFRLTFLEENIVSRHVRAYFERYAARADVAPVLLEPLLRLYLLRRARDSRGEARRAWLECERLVARAPGTRLPTGG